MLLQVKRGLTSFSRSTMWTRWLVVVLMLVMFAQLCLGARHLSMTSDEPSHIVAGITYLATGDLWIPPQHGHPPLINALAAWPLLLQPERPVFQDLAGWGHAFSTYVRAAWPLLGPIERVAYVTRLPIMLMALLLAALVFRWGSEILRPAAGALAVSLMAFDPNLLAHAQLNTTDLGMTFMGFAAVYLAWRAARSRTSEPQWFFVCLSGSFLGLTMAAKGSGFIYGPALIAILGWGYAPTWREQRRLTGLGRLIAQGATMGCTAVLVLWCVYRFQVGVWSAKDITVPFPSHFDLWDIVLRDIQRIAFLKGETKVGGWWWYFLYSTLVKTPLPLLIGILLACVFWLRRGPRWWWKTVPLLVFPLLYWVVAIRSGMNIGHRHLLPTFPFLYVFVGQLTTATSRKFVALRQGLAAALMGWYVVEAVTIYPFYLAYFNQLIGGPRNGYQHLVDSNVAWGQSFIALREYTRSV
jgi:4-amino-4-deoxy-L-arabinose transferase-like glycosyltransferase